MLKRMLRFIGVLVASAIATAMIVLVEMAGVTS